MKKFREILSSGDRGFTLIELLVVIAVLGILAGIAIPRLGGVTDKAKRAEAVSFASTLRSAQEMHRAEYGSYVTSLTSSSGLTTGSGLGEYIDSGVPNGWSLTITNSTDSGYTMKIEGTSDANKGLTVTATPGGVSK